MNLQDRHRKAALAIGLVVLLAIAGCATDYDMNVPDNTTPATADETTHLTTSDPSTSAATDATENGNTTIDRLVETTAT